MVGITSVFYVAVWEGKETHAHLFLHCEVASEAWQVVEEVLGVTSVSCDWPHKELAVLIGVVVLPPGVATPHTLARPPTRAG